MDKNNSDTNGILVPKSSVPDSLGRGDPKNVLLSNYDEVWRMWTVYVLSLDIQVPQPIPDIIVWPVADTGKWWRLLAAGGLSGAISRTCTAPLDRIKIFLQVHNGRITIIDCIGQMLREGGIKGFWRGNSVNVLKIIPEYAIKFSVYDNVKQLIKGPEEINVYNRFCAGAIAGFIAQSATYPFEVLKTRLALSSTGQFTGLISAAASIYKAEGLHSFYRGYLANTIGIIPYAGIELAVYETLKNYYVNLNSLEMEGPTPLQLLACGSVSSTMGQLFTYPLALVKTRMQAANKSSDTSNATIMGILRNTISAEGFLGLYKGMLPNFIKLIPTVTITYIVYEDVSRYLRIKML